jgi:hypothetical protein
MGILECRRALCGEASNPVTAGIPRLWQASARWSRPGVGRAAPSCGSSRPLLCHALPVHRMTTRSDASSGGFQADPWSLAIAGFTHAHPSRRHWPIQFCLQAYDCVGSPCSTLEGKPVSGRGGAWRCVRPVRSFQIGTETPLGVRGRVCRGFSPRASRLIDGAVFVGVCAGGPDHWRSCHFCHRVFL